MPEAGHGQDLALDLVDPAAEGVDLGLAAGALEISVEDRSRACPA